MTAPILPLLAMTAFAWSPPPPCDLAAWRALVREHSRRYPASGAADLYKLLHQATQGSEHAIENEAAAARWMRDEIASLGPGPPEPLVDPLGPGPFVRVHLRPFVGSGGNPSALTRAFVATANAARSDAAGLECALRAATDEVRRGAWAFADAEWLSLLDERRKRAFDAAHHSPAYERAYRPAYRVVARSELPRLGLTLPRPPAADAIESRSTSR